MSIFDNGAGAALGGVAANMGAGELQVLTQYLHQRGVRRYVYRLVVTIDLQLNLHAGSPLGCAKFSVQRYPQSQHNIKMGKTPVGKETAATCIAPSGGYQPRSPRVSHVLRALDLNFNVL
jgi:hypothetical protein